MLRPRVEITTPFFNTSEYLLLDMTATAFVPLSKRVGFTFRAGAGRIFPYGNSLDNVGSESPFVSLLRLRDVTFTAGGTRDVRGWGSQLVGPKLPEVKFESGSGGTVDTVADRYAPVGGLARLVGSAELRLPCRGSGTRGEGSSSSTLGRSGHRKPLLAECRRVGPGQDLRRRGRGRRLHDGRWSPSGSRGYKLNPSPLDLRSPQDVLAALSSGIRSTPSPTRRRRRLHLHFSIGSTF